MKRFFLSLCAAASLAVPANAMETRFSAMVSDVETGLILTSDRIDSPRDPALMGRLATIALALQDLADGNVEPAEVITMGRSFAHPMTDTLQRAAASGPEHRVALTALVNRIGQNARIYKLRLDGVAEMAGLQATAMRVVRGEDGGPAFEGYTTPRDISRLTASVLRAFPDGTKQSFARATANMGAASIWLYQDGTCLLAASGPVSGRHLVAVLTGAPDEIECLQTAADLIWRDDARITDARSAREGR